MPIFKRDSSITAGQIEEHRLQAKVVSPDLDSHPDPEARVVGVVPEDDVFGSSGEDGPNYRNVRTGLASGSRMLVRIGPLIHVYRRATRRWDG